MARPPDGVEGTDVATAPRQGATGGSGESAGALGSCAYLLGSARPPKLAQWAGSTPSWR